MEIQVEIKEDYPGCQWYHLKVILPGYGHDPVTRPLDGVFYLVSAKEYEEEHLGEMLGRPLFRPEYAKAIRDGLNGKEVG